MPVSEYDVSTQRDFAYAIANLIEAECHLHQTFSDTKDIRYLEIIRELRKLRGKYFGEFLKNKTYGAYCTLKHLLSAFMELSEVGTKALDEKKDDESSKFLNASQDIFRLILLINEIKNVNKKGKEGRLEIER